MLPATAIDACQFYAELYCSVHGSIRLGLVLEPERDRHCPVCQRFCPSSMTMCSGYTRRSLPFHELIAGPLPADRHTYRHWRKITPTVKVARMRARR